MPQYLSPGQRDILDGLQGMRQHDARSALRIEPGEPTPEDLRTEELARIEDLMTTPPGGIEDGRGWFNGPEWEDG